LRNRQYSVKVFETSVEDEMKFIEFFDTHYMLFKDHLILVKGEMNETIQRYLEEKPYKFLNNTILPIGRSRKSLEEELKIGEPKIDTEVHLTLKNDHLALKEELKTLTIESGVNQQIAEVEIDKVKNEIKELSKKLANNFMVLDTIVRSGRELKVEGDLLLLNRVNSGATIYTSGNLIITQVVEGALRCDGNFMMITVSPKANIIFNGVEVDNSLLENKLNRIELKDREIYITPVIKKEINWAS
jgi:septum site-determining protein MinC